MKILQRFGLLSSVLAVGLVACNGASARVSTSPSALSFGSVTVNSASSPRTVTVTNNSGREIVLLSAASSLTEFVVGSASFPLTLEPGQSATFQVVFRPDSAKSFSGTVTFAANRGWGAASIIVSGTGTASSSSPPPPTTSSYLLSPSATTLSLGNVAVGSSSSRPLTLTNTGNSSVTLSQVNASGAGFSTAGVGVPFTLAPGQSTSVNVVFAPTASGTDSGNVSVVSDATDSPTVVALSGTGTQPQISVVPGSVNFGIVTTGTTNTQTVTVSNPGNAALTVSQATIIGNGFHTSGPTMPVTVSPGGSTTLTVSFSPTTTAASTGSLSVLSNAPTSPSVIPVAGSGTAASVQLTASPTSLNLSNVNVGSSSSQTVTLTNAGNSTASISQLTISGAGFSGSGLTTPLNLTAGQSVPLTVTFAPTTAGSSSGSVSVTSNATNSPTQIALTGTGVQPATPAGPLPAFPGAEGGGASSAGGRGGVVYEVTTLSDSGAGSLRACVQASGPRTCVFRVGGTIQVLSDMIISSPYLTIAGQTAPGGGILLAGTEANTGSGNGFRMIFVETHDVIIRYLRLRPGPNMYGGGPTNGTVGIALMNADIYNVMIDHVSISWTDNKPWIIYANYGPGIHNVTYQWSMDNEGLAPTAARPNSQSVGGGTGNSNGTFTAFTDIDYHHNFISNHSHRVTEDARASGRQVNNIIYNWSYFADQTQGPQSVDFIGNKFQAGPLTSGAYKVNSVPIEILVDPGNAPGAPAGNPSLYLSGNIGPNQSSSPGNQWVMTAQETCYQCGPAGSLPIGSQRSTPLPAQQFSISADDVSNLENVLLSTVGASQKLNDVACDGTWLANRDAVDTRLVKEYGAGTGIIPTDPSQVGGYPSIAAGTPCASSRHDGIADQWKINYGLDSADTTLYQKTAPNGYTYLENYLNGTKP